MMALNVEKSLNVLFSETAAGTPCLSPLGLITVRCLIQRCLERATVPHVGWFGSVSACDDTREWEAKVQHKLERIDTLAVLQMLKKHIILCEHAEEEIFAAINLAVTPDDLPVGGFVWVDNMFLLDATGLHDYLLTLHTQLKDFYQEINEPEAAQDKAWDSILDAFGYCNRYMEDKGRNFRDLLLKVWNGDLQVNAGRPVFALPDPTLHATENEGRALLLFDREQVQRTLHRLVRVAGGNLYPCEE